MPVKKEKKEALQEQMERLHISEKDLVEKFILGRGKGGQKINKNASCVYVKHLPTGIEVKCQKDRKRELNRFLARRILCEKIAKQTHQEITEKEQALKKIARQKKRRSRRSKEKILKKKKHHSALKTLREKVEFT